MSRPSHFPIAVGLGSNLGDSQRLVEGAVRALRADPDIFVESVSPWYRTKPVGGPSDQNDYCNGVLVGETRLSAEGLLARLQQIEKRFGRNRRREERNGPRTLDLDLLFHGDSSIDEPGLVVPHPRMEERAFVLVPMADVAPEQRLPRSGKTVREVLESLDRSDVVPVSAG